MPFPPSEVPPVPALEITAPGPEVIPTPQGEGTLTHSPDPTDQWECSIGIPESATIEDYKTARKALEGMLHQSDVSRIEQQSLRVRQNEFVSSFI